MNRPVSRVAVVTFCLSIAVGALALPAVAEEDAKPFQLARYVPARSFAFARVPDIAAIQKAISRTSIARILADGEVREFIEPLLGLLQTKFDEVKNEEGIDLLDVATCFRGEVALALVRLDLARGAPYPELVLSIDTRENRAKAEKYLGILIEQIREDNKKLKVTEREVRGHKIRVIEDGRTRLDFTFLGNTFVLASMASTMDGVINAWAGGDAAALEGYPLHEASMRRVRSTGTPVIELFVNMQEILSVFGEALAPYESILAETGVTGIRALTLCSTIEGASFTDRIHIHAPGEKRGIFKLLSPKAIDHEVFRQVPESALYVAAGAYDIAGIWDEVMRVLATVQPDVFADVCARVEDAEKVLGFELKKHLIDSLGGDALVYASMPRGGGLIPEVVLSISVKDQGTLETCVDKSLEVLRQNVPEGLLTRDSTEFRGTTIHFIRIDGGIPVTPTFAFAGGRLIVTLSPQTMKGILRRQDAEEPGASILDNDRFKRALAGAPKGCCALSYTDIATVFNFAYSAALPFLQAMGDGFDWVGLDPAMLPSVEAISRHLEPIASYVWADSDGMTWSLTAPVGVTTLIVPAALATLLIAGPGAEPMPSTETAKPMRLTPPRREARPGREEKVTPATPIAPPPPRPGPIVDLDHLDQLGAALLIYYVENGVYPKDLTTLVEAGCIHEKSILVSPGDESPVDVRGVKCSYMYVGAGVARLSVGKDRLVVAWSRSIPRAVLFLDGTTRATPEKLFKALLADTRSRVGKGGK
jgi:hypothetical protein